MKNIGKSNRKKSNLSKSQWHAVESYVKRFSTKHGMFNALILKQAKDWFETDYLKK
jgi:hypothetical protein